MKKETGIVIVKWSDSYPGYTVYNGSKNLGSFSSLRRAVAWIDNKVSSTIGINVRHVRHWMPNTSWHTVR